MNHQFLKPAYKIVLATLMLSFTVVACNNKGKDSKEPAVDTPAQKMDVPPPKIDTPSKASTTKKDTADTRPVKPGD